MTALLARAFDGAVRRSIGPVARASLRAIASTHDGVASLRATARIRRILPGRDPLFPISHPVSAATIADPALRELLGDGELGVWSIGPDTIGFLLRLFARDRPRTVLECGSGVSTVVLAHLLAMSEIDAPLLIALDQDARFASETHDMLAARQLDHVARVVHAPLTPVEVRNEPAMSYFLGEELIGTLRQRPPDLVFIDGPAAGERGRFGTLPSIQPFVRQASFAMDDAFRDDELAIAGAWATLPGIQVQGIVPVDKGVLVGRVSGLGGS